MEERDVKEFLREAWKFSPKNDAFEIREIRPLDFFTLFVILEKVFPNLSKKMSWRTAYPRHNVGSRRLVPRRHEKLPKTRNAMIQNLG